ncbi:hypothetical protein LRH25_23900 [Ideonella azotifigens]|uniref:Type II toxin-antitoxin system ParD family antitoxin n=1 Tax=Ideonella azotifigens TaxID=513160 RepID=A0ABP3VVS0_9BURK|nr:hypothetical protein [Ideonella azotifigens]MCD2343376.1 hypothetical protein [Ideonella azotifigens]
MSRTVTFNLGDEAIASVQHKVNAGLYPSADAVLEAAILALDDRDTTVANWLQSEGAERHARLKSGTLPTISGDELMSRVRARLKAPNASPKSAA